MPEKSIAERVTDCETFEESLQTELDNHRREIGDLVTLFKHLADATQPSRDLSFGGIRMPGQAEATRRFYALLDEVIARI